MRRRMLLAQAAAAAAVAGCGLVGCAGPGPVAIVPFIDAHAHLNDPALQIELMDAHGAAQALVYWGGRSDHDTLLAAVRRWPGRFVPFASISPERRAYRGAWARDAPAELLGLLEPLLAAGVFRGIGELSPVHHASAGFPAADFDVQGAITTAVLALARRHRVPVVMHVELTRIDAFSELLARHDDVAVVWAHAGYAGAERAARLLQRHPRLTLELSARTWPHPRLPGTLVFDEQGTLQPAWRTLIEREPLRVIVGTDAAGRSRESDAMKFASVQALLRQLDEPVRSLVARGNVQALLGA